MTARLFAAWRAEQDRKAGEAIWKAARRDYKSGALARPDTGLIFAYALAGLVLAILLLCLFSGLWLIWAMWPAALAMVLGAALVALGLYLLPRLEKLPEGMKRRADLPKTFAALDRICERLDTAPMTGVVIDGAFNASVTIIRNERILWIGVLLWESLAADEKLALLGHEISHMVNNDPARGRVIGSALHVTDRWLTVLSPEGSGSLSAELLLAPFAILVEAMRSALLRALYLRSQRAEYLADALGSEISGRDAAIATLEKVSLYPLLRQAMNEVGTGQVTDPPALLQRFAQAVSRPAMADRDRVLAAMRQELLTTDGTHPPTAYRIAFLRDLPSMNTVALLSQELLAPVAAELATSVDRQASRMAAQFEVQ